MRNDLRNYVIDAFGDPGAILVVDLCRACDYAEPSVVEWWIAWPGVFCR